ncbi:hypothetical protein WA158_000638 [Blastocystis sp. Blastoise]
MRNVTIYVAFVFIIVFLVIGEVFTIRISKKDDSCQTNNHIVYVVENPRIKEISKVNDFIKKSRNTPKRSFNFLTDTIQTPEDIIDHSSDGERLRFSTDEISFSHQNWEEDSNRYFASLQQKKNHFSSYSYIQSHSNPSYFKFSNICINIKNLAINYYPNGNEDISSLVEHLSGIGLAESSLHIISSQYPVNNDNYAYTNTQYNWLLMTHPEDTMEQYFSTLSSLNFIISRQDFYSPLQTLFIPYGCDQKGIVSSLLNIHHVLYNQLNSTTFYCDKDIDKFFKLNILCFSQLNIPAISPRLYGSFSSSISFSNLIRSSLYKLNHANPYKSYSTFIKSLELQNSLPQLSLLFMNPQEKQGFYRKYYLNYRELYSMLLYDKVHYKTSIVKFNGKGEFANLNQFIYTDLLVTYLRADFLLYSIYLQPYSTIIAVHLPYQKNTFISNYCMSIGLTYIPIFSTTKESILQSTKYDESDINKCKTLLYDEHGIPKNNDCKDVMEHIGNHDFHMNIISVLWTIDQARYSVYINKYHIQQL